MSLPTVSFLPTLPSLLVEPGRPMIHRDLSWLQFNDRVLAEARQSSNPLLERTKFLAITASNLDEFFMIRFASLGRPARGPRTRKPEAQSQRIRTAILEAVSRFTGKQFEALDLLSQELESAGVRLVKQPFEEDPAFELGRTLFLDQILPHLPPPVQLGSMADLKACVQALENLQLGVFFEVERTHPGVDQAGLWWIAVPKSVPLVLPAIRTSRVISEKDKTTFSDPEPSGDAAQEGAEVPLNDEIFYFTLDDLISSHLGRELRLSSRPPGILRVTRDGDFSVDVDGDPESIPDRVKRGIGKRDRGTPMRLQYCGDFSEKSLLAVTKALHLESSQAFPAPSGLLVLNGLWSIVRNTPPWMVNRPGLMAPPLPPLIPRAFRKEPSAILEKLAREDIILHHPYDSFDAFVLFIREAAQDPHVTLIQQTVYRMDALSPIIDALKMAAHLGKRVRVVIELRARFDELNNLRLADELRRAGVEVAFGFGHLKLHAKVALVTREQDGKTQFFTHLSTGNYNVATSRIYTDLAVMTSHPEIGADARLFFDRVMKGQVPSHFKRLISAPLQLHRKLMLLIEQEKKSALAGKKGHIVIKANALVDEELIARLYDASRSGVKIDLIIRGACSLIPGVKGLSENIRVLSVVDRFLEHSRIYWFGSSETLYLSSADSMPRNFFSRLELAFPVLDDHIKKYIIDLVIPAYLADTARAKELTALGTWKKRPGSRWPTNFSPWLSAFKTRAAGDRSGEAGGKNSKDLQPAFRSQRFFQLLAEIEYQDTYLE